MFAGAPARAVRLGVPLGAALFLRTAGAHAHELSVDQVSLWSDATRSELYGQVSFDPEHTRELDPPLPEAEAQRRALGFVEKNLKLSIDGRLCRPALELRELYTRGGAVPGDVVMLRCPLTPAARTISVSVGEGFESLAVTVAGLAGTAADQGVPERQSVLVLGGGVSPVYHIGALRSSRWLAGGVEQFESEPAAPGPSASVPSASALPDPKPPKRASEPVASPSGKPVEPGAGGFRGQGPLHVLGQYLGVGFSHILPKGFDHVLFVAGLTLGAGQRWRRLLLELSLFTLAHTLTLALGALGVWVVSGKIVEPLIAASIAYVAAENLLGRVSRRQRLLVVFAFGLVHGQGFAGALSELSLPSDAFLSALLGFNLGVEAGQLLVALVLAALVVVLPKPWRLPLVRGASLLTLVVSSYWVLERIFG